MCADTWRGKEGVRRGAAWAVKRNKKKLSGLAAHARRDGREAPHADIPQLINVLLRHCRRRRAAPRRSAGRAIARQPARAARAGRRRRSRRPPRWQGTERKRRAARKLRARAAAHKGASTQHRCSKVGSPAVGGQREHAMHCTQSVVRELAMLSGVSAAGGV